ATNRARGVLRNSRAGVPGKATAMTPPRGDVRTKSRAAVAAALALGMTATPTVLTTVLEESTKVARSTTRQPCGRSNLTAAGSRAAAHGAVGARPTRWASPTSRVLVA